MMEQEEVEAILNVLVKEYNDLLSQKEYIDSRLLSLSDKIDELEVLK